MSLNLFEGLSLGFRNEDVTKETTKKRESSVNPEQSVETDRHLNGGKELQDQEGHGQVEAWDSGAEKIPHACRQHLAKEEERHAGESDGVTDHVDDETDQRKPFQLFAEIGIGGLGVAEEEEESSNRCHGDRHHDAGDEEKDPTTSLVDNKDGHWKINDIDFGVK